MADLLITDLIFNISLFHSLIIPFNPFSHKSSFFLPCALLTLFYLFRISYLAFATSKFNLFPANLAYCSFYLFSNASLAAATLSMCFYSSVLLDSTLSDSALSTGLVGACSVVVSVGFLDIFFFFFSFS